MASTGTMALRGTTSTVTTSTEEYTAASGSGPSSPITVITRTTVMGLRPTGTTARAMGRTTRTWQAARRRGGRYQLHDLRRITRLSRLLVLPGQRHNAASPMAGHRALGPPRGDPWPA